MAPDNPRSDSPPPSPKREPSPLPRTARRVAEEEPRRSDKNYRRYAAGIERALASFETQRQEWADYISFLGRLLKAVQAHPGAIDTLPHRAAVAQRLSQCLNPTLPSGVHQKAIELYSYIFSVVGRDSLAHDLHIYLPGLTPVLSFASLTLRPTYLSLLETHILSLDPSALRPALRSLILSLLPGLEDETSEDFERTLHILDSLKDAVKVSPAGGTGPGFTSGDEYFWQCFFLASISSHSRRQGALTYLVRRLPKLVLQPRATNGEAIEDDAHDSLSSDAESLVSPEPGLLVRCFTTGLCDEQALLQRGFLDLLLTHLPLNSPVLVHRVDENDLERLVGAAVSVVSRRDMSLNRRLWSWLLGPQANEDDPDNTEATSPHLVNGSVAANPSPASSYFVQHGLKPLTNYLLDLFRRANIEPAERARPFRISLSLMDRGEVAGPLVSKTFLPAIDSLRTFQETASDEDFRDVLRSASSFFDGIEGGIIWNELNKLIVSALSEGVINHNDRKRRLILTKFVLDHFNVREEEMLTVHMPLAAILCASMIRSWDSNKQQTSRSADEITELALSTLEKFVTMMPERAHLNSSFGEWQLETDKLPEPDKILDRIQTFYTQHKGNLSSSPPPFSSRLTADMLLVTMSLLLRRSFQHAKSLQIQITECQVLATYIPKMPDCKALKFDELLAGFHNSIKSAVASHSVLSTVPFPTLTAIIHIIAEWMSTQLPENKALSSNFNELIVCLVEAAWTYLTPSYPKYHVEAVRALWQLDDLTMDTQIVEASVSTYLSREDNLSVTEQDQLEFARRFAVLWTHTAQAQGAYARRNSTWSSHGNDMSNNPGLSDGLGYRSLQRPLMLLLDSLNDDDSELHFFVSGWLQSLKDIGVIIEMIFLRILSSTTPALKQSDTKEQSGRLIQMQHGDKITERLYYFQQLLTLLKLSSENVWAALGREPEHLKHDEREGNEIKLLQVVIVEFCFDIVRMRSSQGRTPSSNSEAQLKRVALATILHLVQGPNVGSLQKLSLNETLVEILGQSLSEPNSDTSFRIAILDVVLASLKVDTFLTHPPPSRPSTSHSRRFSTDTLKIRTKAPQIITPNEEAKASQTSLAPKPPPKQLLKCLQDGISSTSSYHMLDSWINFLIEVLPLYADTLFQNVIPLVECLCEQIKNLFQQLNGVFSGSGPKILTAPEPAIVALLTGLEFVLTTAHDRLAVEEQRRNAMKSPEQPQSFFGNVVSGVFTSEVQKGRSATANTRLTVLLCFQDAIRICLTLYSWAYQPEGTERDPSSAGSYGYVSIRLRNKARRILDRIFAAEPLECLEALIVASARQRPFINESSPSPVLNLIHVLDSSRPKVSMPAIFNAIYSRTSPSALDSSRTSTLTSDLTDLELGQFLVDYISSLDADAMDEIWADCMTFLRDVLTNPLPHSQILPSLLLFVVILAEKINNTNFGEQRRMKKELSDLFSRLLGATFSARSVSSQQDPSADNRNLSNGDISKGRFSSRKSPYSNLVDTLVIIVPRMNAVLNEADKLGAAVTNVSTNVVSPAVHSKTFPENVRTSLLILLQRLAKVSQSSKAWRKDVADAFNNQRFFSNPLSAVADGWLPLLRLWTLAEKDRLSEILTRITAPTSAGMLFGVGANAARLEADKKAQVNLRRAALLVLAMDTDAVVPQMAALEEKLIELFGATVASSPSSFTRADTYMLLRALVLRTSTIHLAPLWPLITSELQKALSAALPRSGYYDTYNTYSLLQGCKLLDLLLLTAPEDFQMHAWLFITDTIDAVYRPANFDPIGLVDEIAEELGSKFGASTPAAAQTSATPFSELSSTSASTAATASKGQNQHAALLDIKNANADVAKDDFVKGTLRPWFSQLSMSAFEAAYRMGEVDWAGCDRALLKDLFDDATLIGLKG